MATVALIDWSALFPLPGDPVSGSVIEARRRRAELEANGERIDVPQHDDNCGSMCRNAGKRALVDDCDSHDCCGFCNDLTGDHGAQP